MIGDVHYGKADLAIGQLSMNYERNQLVDFSVPYAIEPITFLSRNIQINSKYGLITFFVQNDWISYTIISAILFSSIIIALFNLAFDPKSLKWILNLRINFNIILEALFLKPHENIYLKKFDHHQNVLSTFWRIFSMIFLVFYSTFIFSSLIRDAKSIESVEELRSLVNDERVRVWYNYVGTATSQLLKVKMKNVFCILIKCHIMINHFSGN